MSSDSSMLSESPSDMGQPRRILYLVIAIVIGMAFVDMLLPWATAHEGAMNVISSLIFALCAFAWVKADAEARGIEPPFGSALMAALMIPIGVPVYLFRALGARRGAWSSLKAFGFIVFAGAIYFGVSYAIALLWR
jgi:hypothetical protein